jgi:hypothetical protein
LELTGGLVPYLAAGVSMPPFCKRAWHDYDTTKIGLMEAFAHIKATSVASANSVLQLISAFAELIPFRETDLLYAVVIVL